jgi:hypothetical protein
MIATHSPAGAARTGMIATHSPAGAATHGHDCNAFAGGSSEPGAPSGAIGRRSKANEGVRAEHHPERDEGNGDLADGAHR